MSRILRLNRSLSQYGSGHIACSTLRAELKKRGIFRWAGPGDKMAIEFKLFNKKSHKNLLCGLIL